MHVVIYLLIVYGLLRYFKRNSCDSGLLINLTGPLPVFHHRRSYTQKAKSKLSPIRNPRDRYVHNSLSNVVIHMPHLALTFACRALSIGNGFLACALTSDCNE